MGKAAKDVVYEALQSRIFKGDLPLGARISELAFAKELGVSRTPVREAFSRLVYEGLAEHVPNAGVYLKKPTRQDIWELYDLRAALETHAVLAASRNLTPQLLETLEAACQAMREILLSIREERKKGNLDKAEHYWRRVVVEAELPFHLSLIREAKNSRLSQLVSNSQMLMRIYSLNYAPNIVSISDVHSYWEHRRILLWLKRGNGEKASFLMREHLTGGRDRMLKFYDQAVAKTEQPFEDEWNWTRQIQNNIDRSL